MDALVEKSDRSSSFARAGSRPDVLILAGLVIGLNAALFLLVQHLNADLVKGDFKMFYTAAIALRSGHGSQLYSRDLYVSLQRQLLPSLPLRDVKVYTHPPYELLVFLPLSFLPYKVAAYLWIAATVMVGVLCGRMLSSYVAVLGLFPFLAMLLEQQDSVLALLVAIACWLALNKGREAQAGFILGLGLFKFPIVLPLALILLFWRPRLLKGLAISGTLVALLSFAMVGSSGIRSYANYLLTMAHASSAGVSERYQIDPRTYPTLRGIAYELATGGGESASPAAIRSMSIALGVLDLLCLVGAWKFMRSGAPPEAKFAFAVLLALLLSFHLLLHDFVLLALPFTLLRGLPARWVLAPFYLSPLVYFFYPPSHAWQAIFPIVCCLLIPFSKSMADARVQSCCQ